MAAHTLRLAVPALGARRGSRRIHLGSPSALGWACRAGGSAGRAALCPCQEAGLALGTAAELSRRSQLAFNWFQRRVRPRDTVTRWPAGRACGWGCPCDQQQRGHAGEKELGGLKLPELGGSGGSVLGTGAERCWHKWVLTPVSPARLGISPHAQGSGKHNVTAGSLLPMPEPAVELGTLPNVPSIPGYSRPGWVVAGSRRLLSQGVNGLLFLASWTLVCGRGCCQACGHQGGLQPAQAAQPAGPPLLAGQDPFPAPWGHQLDPL